MRCGIGAQKKKLFHSTVIATTKLSILCNAMPCGALGMSIHWTFKIQIGMWRGLWNIKNVSGIARKNRRTSSYFSRAPKIVFFRFLLITKSLRGDKIKASNDALKRLRSISFLLLKDFSSNSPLDWPQRFTYVGCGTNRGLESRIRSILLPWPWRSSKKSVLLKNFSQHSTKSLVILY